jgi:hypothetical protein
MLVMLLPGVLTAPEVTVLPGRTKSDAGEQNVLLWDPFYNQYYYQPPKMNSFFYIYSRFSEGGDESELRIRFMHHLEEWDYGQAKRSHILGVMGTVMKNMVYYELSRESPTRIFAYEVGQNGDHKVADIRELYVIPTTGPESYTAALDWDGTNFIYMAGQFGSLVRYDISEKKADESPFGKTGSIAYRLDHCSKEVLVIGLDQLLFVSRADIRTELKMIQEQDPRPMDIFMVDNLRRKEMVIFASCSNQEKCCKWNGEAVGHEPVEINPSLGYGGYLGMVNAGTFDFMILTRSGDANMYIVSKERFEEVAKIDLRARGLEIPYSCCWIHRLFRNVVFLGYIP